jgi:hypothetical protein
MGKETRRRERSCWQVARSRAQHTRRIGRNRFLAALVFVLVLMRILLSVPVPAPKRLRPQKPGEWPVTEYERGPAGPQRRHQPRRDRYPARPSIRRLMRDLRRPAARADAERALLARLGDADLRGWVSDHIRKDRINRLSIYAREGIPEEAVVAAWRADLDAERAAKVEAADEAREQAHILRAISVLARKESTDATRPLQ